MHIESHPATRTRNAENTWEFTKVELAALLTCASKDDTRANLFGVSLDSANRTAFSTDGHRLLAATAPESLRVESDAGKRIIPRSAVEIAVRSARRKTDRISIRPNGTKCTIVVWDRDGGAVSHSDVPLGEGTPPPWQQVIPAAREQGTTGAAAVVGISPRYLADVQTLSRVVPGAIQLHIPDTPLEPILVVADDPRTAYWRCVIMPMRL